jgi:hypothetical protein
MRRWLMITFLALALLSPGITARADNPIILDSLIVYLRPEYDKPSMLVNYEISIDPDVSLPVTLSILIPTRIGYPDHITTLEVDGTSTETPYERSIQGEWSAISITATGLNIEIEYHDPDLRKEQAIRSFSFSWVGNYDLKSLTVGVLQPVGSKYMQISPFLGEGIPEDNGTVRYNADLGPIEAGSLFTLSLQYQKSDDELTISAMRVQPIAPLSAETTGRAPSLALVLIWIIGGLAAILIVIAGLWLWRTGHLNSVKLKGDKPAVRPEKPGGNESNSNKNSSLEGKYCQQCGNRIQEGDLFCRICGAKLRREMQ